jgi:chromosome segregation ATPase
MANEIPSNFLTKSQASQSYKVSRVTLDKRVKSGAVSSVRGSDGRVYIDPAELSRVFGVREDTGTGVKTATVKPDEVQRLKDHLEAKNLELEIGNKEIQNLKMENEKLSFKVNQIEYSRDQREKDISKQSDFYESRIDEIKKAKDDEIERLIKEKEDLKRDLKEESSKGFFKRIFG